MLKTQLKSKIQQVYPKWRDIEDLLTGDFFGVLDYLPREPYLKSFFAWVFQLNEQVVAPDLNDVKWDSVELSFWPMKHLQDESTEPDLVIVSNKWVFIVEVKLLSGLGIDQLWREYMVGKEIAAERGLSSGSVYLLTVALSRLDIGKTFKQSEHAKRKELLDRTFQLRWWQVIALITNWLRDGKNKSWLLPEHTRLLNDLLQAMRMRRRLAFSGYSTIGNELVMAPLSGIFCTDLFGGFLSTAPATMNSGDGVLTGITERFQGFLNNALTVSKESEAFLVSSSFSGFLVDAPICSPEITMVL